MSSYPKGEKVSRRSFVRNTSIGAASVAFALSGAESILAKNREEGEITLDALMITYLAAPIGSVVGSSWFFTDNYSFTLRAFAAADRELLLRGSAQDGKRKVFLGAEFEQAKSDRMKNGLSLRYRDSFGIGTGVSDAPPVAATADDTAFFVILRPRLSIEGDSRLLRFGFIESGAETLLRVANLKTGNSPLTMELSADTRNSWLSQYVTDPAVLTEPRFDLQASGSLSAGVRLEARFTERGNTDSNSIVVASTTAKIVEQTGFRSDVIKQTFEVGKNIELNHFSVNDRGGRIITMDLTLERAEAGVNKIYYDRVFKNFVVMDAGPPALFSQPTVSGRVTDGAGLAVPEALVKLRAVGVDFFAQTDADGCYTIATAEGEPLPSGSWAIGCGNLSQSVEIDGYVRQVDFGGVDTEAARSRSFDSDLQQ